MRLITSLYYNTKKLRLKVRKGEKDNMVLKKNIKTKSQALRHIRSLKSRVAKDNAIRWFIKNRKWYL